MHNENVINKQIQKITDFWMQKLSYHFVLENLGFGFYDTQVEKNNPRW